MRTTLQKEALQKEALQKNALPNSLQPQELFAERLLSWFEQQGRKNLPWQQGITPYSVWVSETMLQQTQVNTVIPYYLKFMASFPSVQILAAASQDQVLHHWTGLGYYARGRNLHKTAQIITDEFNSIFPDTVAQLETLPGIGRSTAGAICAIAYQRAATILDGNVKRVLARQHAVAGWSGHTATNKQLWTLADHYTPKHHSRDYTQAMMDLGATLCTRTQPRCPDCPVSNNCKAFALGQATDYPGKKPKKISPVKQCLFLIIRNPTGEILLEQRPVSGLWGGLWVFPQCDDEFDIKSICTKFGCKVTAIKQLPPQRHSFSHFHLDYQPVVVEVSPPSSIMDSCGIVWYNPKLPLEIGTAQPVKQLLENLK